MEKTDNRKIYILLIEDDLLHQELLAAGLEEYYNCNVARARNLREAEEHLQTIIPDLLVLDCVLDNNRFLVIEWAEKVRRRAELLKVPILFVTAYYPDMEKWVREIEGSDVLVKPFTFEDITQKLRGLISRPRE